MGKGELSLAMGALSLEEKKAETETVYRLAEKARMRAVPFSWGRATSEDIIDMTLTNTPSGFATYEWVSAKTIHALITQWIKSREQHPDFDSPKWANLKLEISRLQSAADELPTVLQRMIDKGDVEKSQH